ncbi:MAG TPA: ABC transporter ATP-binding protein [Terracidiphilus sp.]|nr:ABC transporter ATP-binding protein [Terracidiphilus sp.]
MLISSEPRGEVAIRCTDLGKRYRIGERARYHALRDTISTALTAPWRLLQRNAESIGDDATLWALRGLSLEVRHGEVLGIIGRNGSGKSTLLKLLSRITRPTEGVAEINGRLGTLLEVGAGFHPELTGRENIYLNGAILGMRRKEIDRKFDEIVAFSECERMLDTAMKHYSSGMYVRLAFAVAAHLETEILLVDEVLAVGDAVFQKKCLGKMNDVAHEGRTVLFVSHNMLAIDGLCSRAICLHDGKDILDGSPSFVTSTYLKNWLPLHNEVIYEDYATAPGHELIRLHRASARPLQAENAKITINTPILVEFSYWSSAEHSAIDLAIQIRNEHGIDVFASANGEDPTIGKGLLHSSIVIPADLLNSGTYSVSLFAQLGSSTYLAEWLDIIIFEVFDEVSPAGRAYYQNWPGVVRPRLSWQTRVIAPLPRTIFEARRHAE